MKISNDMFDENDKKVIPSSNGNSNNDVNLESDAVPKQNKFAFKLPDMSGMEKWKKIVMIVVAVIVLVVGIVAVKSFISPPSNNEPKTAVSSSSSNSSSKSNKTNKDVIKDLVKSSESSSNVRTKESSNSTSKNPETNNSTTETDSSEMNINSSTKQDDTPKDSDVSSVQQRIQDSLPDLMVGDTHLHTNTDVVVHSEKVENGIESTLTANNKPFAVITTKDNMDSLKLLSGYQSFASEIKTQK